MNNPEMQKIPEAERLLTEQDLRYGILISVAIQGSVTCPEDVYCVLPEDLRMVADLNIVRPHIYEEDARQALEDYLHEDETIRGWIIRDEEGSYGLSSAGITEMDALYASISGNQVAWNTLNTVIEATALETQ